MDVIKQEKDRKGKTTWSHKDHRIYSLQRTKWTLAIACVVKIRETVMEQMQEAPKDLGPL